MSGKYLPYTDNIMDCIVNQRRRTSEYAPRQRSVTSNFLCEILPNVQNTCQVSCKPSHRSQETLHFDGLPPYCCGAVDRGLLDPSVQSDTSGSEIRTASQEEA
jgi:hypothetical protein